MVQAKKAPHATRLIARTCQKSIPVKKTAMRLMKVYQVN